MWSCLLCLNLSSSFPLAFRGPQRILRSAGSHHSSCRVNTVTLGRPLSPHRGITWNGWDPLAFSGDGFTHVCVPRTCLPSSGQNPPDSGQMFLQCSKSTSRANSGDHDCKGQRAVLGSQHSDCHTVAKVPISPSAVSRGTLRNHPCGLCVCVSPRG